MFPSKSREARAGNGAAGDPAQPSQGDPSLNDERMSHLQPNTRGRHAADRISSPDAAPATKDAGALLIGGGVEVRGRIGSCDALVVEGMVESTIECRSLEIRENGVVTGEAAVEMARIEGSFDGKLVVTGCLTVHASGRVSGSVHYGEIEIERGGEIVGEIASVASRTAREAAVATDHEIPARDSLAEDAASEEPAFGDPAAEELAARIEAL